MFPTFSASVRDGLSNLAASLGAGKDKAASDAFLLRELSRAEIEAMYRGDWLARKVVDIVPADMCREWRAWSGHRADVARIEAAERRLGLRRAVQRAMVLGRLHGGSAIVIGMGGARQGPRPAELGGVASGGESDPATLAWPLDPADVRPGALRFLHVVSRWQLGAPGLDRDPLSPWCGEAEFYEVVAPGRGALRLHPSRVVRFLGNPWPDPSLAPTPWSDSVLQVLYDAVHAVALTVAGATSLMHEAKVDVVTVPNLSEHLSSAETTNQLSARFGYAAAMKSINNLLLLGDGETWNRQKVDFAGLPEMVRTFLQVAAGAADIPVTRLLGQSPAGLSATGESDTRNYYDMIAARQELELRPALEKLDRIIAASEGLDASALTFAFRPLWQLDAATAATIALQKAQATQVYAGLKLWSAATTARLVQAQLAEDGTYPNGQVVFGEGASSPAAPTLDFDPDQPRDWHGRWTTGGQSGEVTAGIVAVKADASPNVEVAPRRDPSPSEAPGSAAASAKADPIPGTLPRRGEASLITVSDPIGMASGPDDPVEGGEGNASLLLPSTQIAVPARIIAPLIGAALLYLYGASKSAVQEIVKHLPSWPHNEPSGPGPSGSGPPPSEAPQDPRPLTIHGAKGLSGPPASFPVGSKPSSPPGLPLAPPPPQLPPSVPVRPLSQTPAAGPAPTSSDPTQPPGYIFNQQGGDPPDDKFGRKPVWAIDIPSGLTIRVKSGIPSEEGIAYEGDVRKELQFDHAPVDKKPGGEMPDGIMTAPNSNEKIALEVKYLSVNERPLRDPDRDVKFIFKKDLAQARKYLDAYKGGVLWVTNDENLATKYGEEFNKAKLSGIRIVVIPSVQE